YSPTTGYGYWTGSTATTFASIACGYAGCPFGKLRTGTQTGSAYTFVTQATGSASGNILQFAVPLATVTPVGGFRFSTPTAVVATSASTTADSTTGSPAGIVVAPQAVTVASAAACASAAGCKPTGGLLTNIVAGASGVGPQGVHGNVIQQTCIVTDPRVKP